MPGYVYHILGSSLPLPAKLFIYHPKINGLIATVDSVRVGRQERLRNGKVRGAPARDGVPAADRCEAVVVRFLIIVWGELQVSIVPFLVTVGDLDWFEPATRLNE